MFRVLIHVVLAWVPMWHAVKNYWTGQAHQQFNAGLWGSRLRGGENVRKAFQRRWPSNWIWTVRWSHPNGKGMEEFLLHGSSRRKKKKGAWSTCLGGIPKEFYYILNQPLHLPHVYLTWNQEPTEAASHAFLHSQHLARAWLIVRILIKRWSNNAGFKFRFGYSVGSTRNHCQPSSKSLQFIRRTGLKRGRWITTTPSLL